MRFSRDDVQSFAAWSADRNPLHVDADFARQTHFGRPIVHGVLTALRALDEGIPPGRRVTGFDIEFRSAAVTDDDYEVRTDLDGHDLIVSLHSREQLVLSARVDFAQAVEPEGAAAEWVGRCTAGVRDTPAARTIDELESGVEVLGTYSFEPLAAHAGVLTHTQARVAALCSYIVGMELPGLRSLFTRLQVRYLADAGTQSELRFRARTSRFDRTFRLLDTEILVATPSGELVATAAVRSYVPFSPQPLDLGVLADAVASLGDDLRDKVALVVGGSRGLGAEIAASLAFAGCRVYASGRSATGQDAEWLQSLAARGVMAEVVPGDAADAAWCEQTLTRLLEQHGRVDYLVLNACAPPSVLRVGPGSMARHAAYIRDNLALVETPLAMFADALQRAGGRVVCISSSYVDEAPPGFSHYVSVKQGAESLVRSLCRERPQIGGVIVRPPQLQTRWNDTPAGVVSAIHSHRAAFAAVKGLTVADAGAVTVVTDFPAVAPASTPRSAVTDFRLRVAATFTTDPLVAPLEFWLRELEINGDVVVAPYGQVLQSLLNPSSELNERGRGLNVVFIRVRDWLRELPDQQAGDIDFIRGYLEDTRRDLEQAIRTHRGHTAAETLLLVCPSHGALSSAENIVVRQAESELVAALADVPGLQVLVAADHHQLYDVNEDEVYDSLRDHIAHIPYSDDYLHVLATLLARQLHRRVAPLRKVVVVDCDNTLWRGVVGEVGPEGIEFDAGHLALHETLERLAASGVLVCLCSKNEEADVWRVFETRSDMTLRRASVVAAMVNWLPKSQNLRTLAARLNLGLDSFVFIDDNPVECAEVRAGCPEVLTVEWPQEASRAARLLQHFWELDPRSATKEDARRTEMYKEEFRRQELRSETLTFEDFIKNLQLAVDFQPLAPEDVRRAAQLTLRTNQFNFTTIRRDEAELQALVAAGQHEVRTVRVRDRFGDYGLVGLVIAERGAVEWTLDTFLLSCRVLGRGAEHRIMADLGEMARDAGAQSVRMRVVTTKRNRPARAFLESIVSSDLRHGDEGLLQCDVPVDVLANVRFEPATAGEVVVQEDSAAPSSSTFDAARLRRREQHVARCAFELATGGAVRAAVDGRGTSAETSAVQSLDDVEEVVHATFARALRVSADQIAAVDRLESLGCDSLKIVEITVALSEKFPRLPGTLLFEHPRVSDIVREIRALAATATESPSSKAVSPSVEMPTQKSTGTDVAVVGLHLRCAGANSPGELWDLLSRGASAVGPVPENRSFFLQPLADTRPHWAGLIDDPARFDAELFGVSPREAEFMDPQLRLFLEVAWNALEDAGCIGDDHDTNTGVFAGVMYGDYGARANVAPAAHGNAYRCWEGFSLANRLSQLLGFSGPSLAVDTACSSSGTALHLACSALNAGDCRVAVVGGVNLILDPDRFASLGRLGILSERGKCEPFGADADGTVLGEGAGVVVLRPLDDALARGDRIYGVIKGTGLSTGNGTVGFTAPNPHAQAEAIRRALAKAAIDPRTVSYVETHGTGTHLGDPIEVRGLTLGYGASELYDRDLDTPQRVRIGSIKPNIGHLEAGAGLLGVIKVLLQMHRGMLLPSITSAQPNPHIAFAQGTFDVQTTFEPWEQRTAMIGGQPVRLPRRAAVSSFGVGGANAHIVIEESPAVVRSGGTAERPAHVMVLSAKNEAALARQAASLKDAVAAVSPASLPDVCFSINTGRKHLSHRAALPAASSEELVAALTALAERKPLRRGAVAAVPATAAAPKVAFLFTGQGSQYAGMGRELYATQPVFRDALDRCAAPFNRLLDRPLLELLFAEEGSADAQLLNQTGYTQPAMFAFQYALAEMWASWGVRPDIVMGHSVGEIAALCVAGGVSLDDSLKLIAARGRLMQALPAGGTMTSVMADESRVLAAIAGAEELVAIAAINAPGQIVISGDGTAVAAIAARLSADGVKTKNLTVSHAFHSPLMKPMLADYEREVRTIRFTPPTTPFVSCVEGVLVTDQVTRPEYWLRQVMDPVRFAAGISTLSAEQVDVFVEIGPQPVLLGMGRQCVEDDGRVKWLPSLRREGDTWTTLLGSLSTLYVSGVPVTWKGFDAPYERRRVAVPGYDFSRKQYWLKRAIRSVEEAMTPLVTSEESSLAAYDIEWRAQSLAGTGSGTGQRWVVVARDQRSGDALVERLRAEGAEATLAHDARAAAGTAGAASRIAYVAGEMSAADVPATLIELTEAIKALNARGVATPSIWVITRDGVAVDARDEVNPAQATLWGFGRSASLEHPELWGALVDTDEAGDVAALARELVADGAEDQVVIRGAGRYVPRLVKRELVEAKPQFRSDGTFLVTGGLGALGLRAAEWLIDRGARHVVLTSRRVTEAAQSRVKTLEARGAIVSVVAADVSRAEDVDRLFAYMGSSGVPLRGIVHAAGVDAVVPVRELSREHIEAMLASKVTAVDLLHQRSQDADLDLFLCFSSISAVLGSQGRAHYAAANAYLDAFVARRRLRGLAGTSVRWGPWQGGGMASDTHLQSFQRIGNRGLRPEDALAMLDRVVGSKSAGVSVMDIDWPTFGAVYQAKRVRPLIEELVAAGSGAPSESGAPSWVEQLRRASPADRVDELQKLLQAEVADTMGFDDVASVPTDRSFYEIGIDSLMMADLVGRLKQRVGVSVTAAVFNHPNVQALAANLVQQLPLDETTPVEEPAPADSGSGPRLIGYEPQAESDIVAFHAAAWPQRSAELTPARWRWMFVDSARRLGLEPKAWLYRDNGRIVGHMGSIAVRLKMGAEQRDTGWLVDTMVLPEYRSQALGSRLMIDAHEEQPFSLSLGQTAEMREIQLRLGWRQVAPLQIAQLVLRPDSVLKGKLPAPAAWAAGLGLRASSALRGWLDTAPHYAARPVERFDERHDRLWQSVARSIECGVVRDASYLNWKYIEQPGNRFHAFDLVEGDELRGVAVWMVREPDRHYRYRRAFLVDVVAPLDNGDVLQRVLKSAVAAIAGHNVDAAICLHIDARLTRALRACGFYLRAPERYLLVDPGPLTGDALARVLSADNWFVTQGDSDIDRPAAR